MLVFIKHAYKNIEAQIGQKLGTFKEHDPVRWSEKYKSSQKSLARWFSSSFTKLR